MWTHNASSSCLACAAARIIAALAHLALRIRQHNLPIAALKRQDKSDNLLSLVQVYESQLVRLTRMYVRIRRIQTKDKIAGAACGAGVLVYVALSVI